MHDNITSPASELNKLRIEIAKTMLVYYAEQVKTANKASAVLGFSGAEDVMRRSSKMALLHADAFIEELLSQGDE